MNEQHRSTPAYERAACSDQLSLNYWVDLLTEAGEQCARERQRAEKAEAEVARLRQVIRDAPHAEGCPCDGMPSHWTLNKNSDEPCDCWKRDALG